ncbi:MBL fold metallo-hydrolase [Lichenicoccus sp.]|uniref:MBL fold metallo-hydrolase n=1 Tax=Lichenicoccus sp. TaxID=2781899 RepID=UPI003D0C7A68
MPPAPKLEVPRFEIVSVTPFQQNCCILWDPASRAGIIIDPGGDAPLILKRVAALGLRIEAILLTHGHLDHAGGVEDVREGLASQGSTSPSQVPVIGPDRRDAFLLAAIAAQAQAMGIPGMRNASPDRYIEEGEVLELAGRRFEVLLVPGHTPGHVVFFDRAAGLLIGGDALFAGSVGRTDFPYCDGPLLIRSIKDKLLPLGDEVVVMPGHGPSTRIGDERCRNPFLQ